MSFQVKKVLEKHSEAVKTPWVLSKGSFPMTLLSVHKQSLSTTSIMDCQLLRQKVCQKISVIKTNTCDDITKIVHFGILIHFLS